MLKVGARGPGGLMDALLLGQSGIGNPEPSTRSRRRAAIQGRLVDHQYFQTFVRSSDCRRHSRGTSADHQHIKFGFPLVH
ncbi:hypothetical protein D3C71_1800880 [compost metagenome]